MEILACDYCFTERQEIVQAVELIPEMILPFSKRRIPKRGVCQKCLDEHFPDLPRYTIRKRRTKQEMLEQKEPRKSRKSKAWETRKKHKHTRSQELWNCLIATSKRVQVPVGDLNRTFSRKFQKTGKDKAEIRAAKIAWLKSLSSKNELVM